LDEFCTVYPPLILNQPKLSLILSPNQQAPNNIWLKKSFKQSNYCCDECVQGTVAQLDEQQCKCSFTQAICKKLASLFGTR
jgi:hypothetical protein